MTDNERQRPYLNFWETVNFLAFGEASESAGTSWRETEIKLRNPPDTRPIKNAEGKAIGKRSTTIENEEAERFFAALGELQDALSRMEFLKPVLGKRCHRPIHEEIATIEWQSLGFNVLGGFDGEGSAEPKDISAYDRDEHTWTDLLFPAGEVLKMREPVAEEAASKTLAAPAKTREHAAIASRRRGGPKPGKYVAPLTVYFESLFRVNDGLDFFNKTPLKTISKMAREHFGVRDDLRRFKLPRRTQLEKHINEFIKRLREGYTPG